MTRPEHWEPPLPQQLLVSARRVAAELDIPAWKAHQLCWALDRRFYAPGGAHFRVTRASLDALKDLLDQGLSLNEARTVVYRYGRRNQLPPRDLTQEQVASIVRQDRYGSYDW